VTDPLADESPLGGLAAVVVLLCVGGWFLLRTTDAGTDGVPAPITVPARSFLPDSAPRAW
jgi:hypothetical protein